MKDELYPSWIELSRSALEKNVSFLKDYVGKDTLFSSVIKGNAYGHGIKHFVPLAEEGWTTLDVKLLLL